MRQLARQSKQRIDETRSQGWDLMAETVRQMKREVATADARLASARKVC